MNNAEYFERFFDEKDLPFQSWEFDWDGWVHYIDSETVIGWIKTAPEEEQEVIRATLMRIDFVNGDTMDYLKYIARRLVETW